MLIRKLDEITYERRSRQIVYRRAGGEAFAEATHPARSTTEAQAQAGTSASAVPAGGSVTDTDHGGKERVRQDKQDQTG